MFGKFKKENKNKNKKVTLMDLEQEKNKAKLHVGAKKNEKQLKPSTTKMLKIIKYFVWGTLIFIFMVGALQMIRSKQPRIIKNIVEYNFAPAESETAQAFALAFTKEYLTYENTKPEDFYGRVSPFMVNALRSSAGVQQSKGSCEVLDTVVWKVEKLNNEHSNIVIRAEVKITNKVDVIQEMLATGEIVTHPKIEKKVKYLLVPIGYYDGSYIVEDYPTFMAEPERPTEATIQTFAGNETVLEDQKEEIKEVLDNFFKTYTTGNKGQISYYMENNKKIKGYEGNYSYNGIRNLAVYKTSKDEVISVIQIGMKDIDLDTLFTQRYIIKLIRKSEQTSKDRWYIREFTVRGNIFEKEKGGV